MNFEGDAFISYAHMDNVELIEGHRGWVSNLHRALELRVGQLLGKQPNIWRDPKLQGNDFFEETLVERLQRVAALVPVISPRYVRSEWTRKELAEFWKAAHEQGGVRFQEKVRVFKVLKTPVPLEQHPPELQPLLGYEFFKVDSETGRVRELDEVFGAEAQREFWLKLDDLAHDICCLLEMLAEKGKTSAESVQVEQKTVFLAETTSDLTEQREALKRDLVQHGYTVLPAHPLPSVASKLRTAVLEDLERSKLSVHLIGKNYSLVPEGATDSLLEIQNQLAIERQGRGNLARLLWIPPGLQVTDERQRNVIERFRTDSRSLRGADLLETFFEDLRTLVHDRLRKTEIPRISSPPVAAPAKDLLRIYLIYDKRDTELTKAWADFLFEKGLELVRPVFEGDEAEIRDDHEENLRTCDAALIFYGAGNECWIRRKLRELQKSAGYGRSKPIPVVGIALLAPRTADKEQFRSHESLVMPQFEGFTPGSLQQFVSRLQA
jgi:TIR domain